MQGFLVLVISLVVVSAISPAKRHDGYVEQISVNFEICKLIV